MSGIELNNQAWMDHVERLTRIEEKVRNMEENHLPHINSELRFIREKLSRYRPPWALTVIITVLCSLCTGLVIVALK